MLRLAILAVTAAFDRIDWETGLKKAGSSLRDIQAGNSRYPRDSLGTHRMFWKRFMDSRSYSSSPCRLLTHRKRHGWRRVRVGVL